MKKIFLAIIAIQFLCACNLLSMKSRDVDNYYQASGIEKYFLNDVPEWLNFNETLECKRKRNIQFFDLPLMAKSFQISFGDLIQFQASYNEEYIARSFVSKANPFSLQDKQFLFYKSLDKINNQIKTFNLPKFKTIYLVLVDSLLEDSKKLTKLKEFLNSSTFNNGYPVLISFCYTVHEIEEKFSEKTYSILPAEMTTTFLENGAASNKFYFSLESIFPSEYQLRVYKSKELKNIKLFSETIKEFQF